MDAVSCRISGLEGSFHRVEPGGSMGENGGQGNERARAVCETKGLADRSESVNASPHERHLRTAQNRLRGLDGESEWGEPAKKQPGGTLSND